jgi:putative alpha-1,2-mannosidase
VAISYVSVDNAEANLAAENPRGRTFAFVPAGAYAAWQRPLRKIGIAGGTDDQHSTFYTALYHVVFSALGLYPTVPTRADLVLSTPLFPKAVIHVGSGKDITLRAAQASAANKYIQALTVNGKPSHRAWIPSSMLATGGTLVYTVAATPNLEWGNSPADIPPQASTPDGGDAGQPTASR